MTIVRVLGHPLRNRAAAEPLQMGRKYRNQLPGYTGAGLGSVPQEVGDGATPGRYPGRNSARQIENTFDTPYRLRWGRYQWFRSVSGWTSGVSGETTVTPIRIILS